MGKISIVGRTGKESSSSGFISSAVLVEYYYYHNRLWWFSIQWWSSGGRRNYIRAKQHKRGFFRGLSRQGDSDLNFLYSGPCRRESVFFIFLFWRLFWVLIVPPRSWTAFGVFLADGCCRCLPMLGRAAFRIGHHTMHVCQASYDVNAWGFQLSRYRCACGSDPLP